MFIPIIIGVLSTVTEGLLKGLKDLEIRGRVEAIQTTTQLKSAGIRRRVMETCYHSSFSERSLAIANVKNSRSKKKNNNNKKKDI